MPPAPRYDIVDEKQRVCNDAISSLLDLQRRAGRHSNSLSPSEFTHYLRWHVISEYLLTGTPMKEDAVRLISKWWWAYLQKQFQLPDFASSRIQLDKFCIDPLAARGILVRTPKKDTATVRSARKNLAIWLRRTYFTDRSASNNARPKDSMDEMMTAFVDSLEPELVSEDDEW